MTDSLIQADHPFYQDLDMLHVTGGQEIVQTLACHRVLLSRDPSWPTFHVGGEVVRTPDGVLHAVVHGSPAAQRWASKDGGFTWFGQELDLPGLGPLVALQDGSFIAAAGRNAEAIDVLRLTDSGATWEQISGLSKGIFDAMHIDSNLLQLRDGTLLLAANLRLDPPSGRPFGEGYYPQYVFRSEDSGNSWQGGGDPEYWQAVQRGEQQIDYFGPQYSTPGQGGTFDGVYETGFCELSSGTIMGAFRMSGVPRQWHAREVASWGEPPVAVDGIDRLFRHIVLGESDDGGRSWRDLRPIVDADGAPIMAHGECNGELVELSDGRLVLVHQTRYAEPSEQALGYFRGRSQTCARVSLDRGRTWMPERYRVVFGFGYSTTMALEDDTLITVTGASLGDDGYPRRAAVIRWRVAD